MFLAKEVTALEEMINHSSLRTPGVSQKAVDWHIDHVLKVIIRVSNTLKKSDPSAYKWKFNMIRSIIYLSGSIPRGRGRSPKAVLPPKDIKKEDLYLQFDHAIQELNEIENLPAKSNFEHPYFGLLNLKMTLKFLNLHTNHHLKIMKDIVKSHN